MPQLGETVTEGTIIRWLKHEGDAIAQDEPLFEVSTDKVDSEVPSPVAGILREILVEEGQTVDVGARLAVVGDGAAAAPEAPAAPPPAAVQEPPAVAAPPPPPPAPAPAPAPAPTSAPADITPAAQVEAADGSSSSSPSGTRGALLSPVVRRLISENGLDTADIPGTGMGGRITRDDVVQYIDQQHATPAQAPAAQAPTAPAPAAPGTTVTPVPQVPAVPQPAPARAAALTVAAAPLGVRDEVVPFTAIRRVTAEHMVRSKATSAHALVAVEADFESVERVRNQQKDRFHAEEGVALTYLPFISRAVVDVLRDYPHLNSSVGDDALIVHRDIHLGYAVDLNLEGLIVPVVHNADGQSLRGLARSVADLAARARSRKLSADDITGGTFTITNPGSFGTFITVPIIAQPQVAILSTDGVKRRPVVVVGPDGSEAIAIHSVGMLALSFDHRAIDGAYASAFLRDVAQVIETRDWAAEL